MKQDAFTVATGFGSAKVMAIEAALKVRDVKVIVNLGIAQGYSVFHFAENFPKALVFGVDSYDESNEERKKFESFVRYFPNIRFLNGTTEKVASYWKHPVNYLDIDVLLIDADHAYDGIKRDFELWSPFVRPEGLILFHDICSCRETVGRFVDELIIAGHDITRGNLDSAGLALLVKE